MIKSGDEYTHSGTDYKIESIDPMNGKAWVRYGASAFGFSTKAVDLFWLQEELARGRAVLKNSQQGAEVLCFHSWKRYVGLNEVEDYCTKCNKKQKVDWTRIQT